MFSGHILKYGKKQVNEEKNDMQPENPVKNRMKSVKFFTQDIVRLNEILDSDRLFYKMKFREDPKTLIKIDRK
jgi:hypothetical protein